ncbi:hypothetical protein RO3G_13013 [Rhizopus delemar RA 99-880]|uniref:Indigoidine synthase A like protein n=1 Tax=Rhizopus delemar (strain RA 99-880 / ATCC MYA-4621 / FGSC 9543 / NRRL 43880) TaxID=246409 RepID=I1CIM2_RHIO9|nr:hypothetical protein RO3G_13013 [Rhizopus delemar RA 99-880]|eukprot:EIE88302.1 hypothetical protein RO3G_13013 [Rhizopus delemar RA 99-880]
MKGLTEEHLEYLGKTGREAIKTSRRDLPIVLSQNKTGATTVASTMLLARAAGIPIFVTGGIGGVHRGASECVKSILDIHKTLEVLETQGVTVTTVGKTRAFPAFYTPDSGFSSPYHVESPLDAAKAICKQNEWDAP